MSDNNITTAGVEAAVMNAVSEEIGEWSDNHGFHNDWHDAYFIEKMADHIVILSIAAYGNRGRDIDREAATQLREIAQIHRRLANVQKLMLMVSELSEALEGMRNGDEANYGEELADVVIRVFDNASKNNIAIGDQIIQKMAVNSQRKYLHGRKF